MFERKLVISEDGRLYDFRPFRGIEPLASIAVSAFNSFLSTNGNAGVRKRSNATVFHNILGFLNFALKEGVKRIDLEICHAYNRYLDHREYAAITKINMYGALANIADYAIASKLIPDFQVPRRGSLREARKRSGPTKTIVDYLNLDGSSATWRSRSEANRAFIAELEDFCWKRIHEIRDRQRQGRKWRDEMRSDRRPARDVDLAKLPRAEALRIMVQRHWRESDGVEQLHSEGLARRWTVEQLSRGALRKLEITIREVADHLTPTIHQVSIFAPLFAIARMNVSMIAALEIDMLKDSVLDKNKKIIDVYKGRANREKSFIRAMGGENARTIPRAFVLLRELCDEIRPYANPKAAKLLFITVSKSVRASKPKVDALDLKWASEYVSREFHAIKGNSQYLLITRLEGRIKLGVIRTTVFNLDRRDSTIEKTQELAQHAHVDTTANYLDTPETNAMLDDEIDRGVRYFVGLVEKRALFIRPDAKPAVISKSQDITLSQARSLLRDEFNNGYGVSFVGMKLFVIDEPMNCLRVMMWLNKMKDAQQRIESNNPERWKVVYVPQIALFEQILKDFPRRTVAQALKIDKEQLVMPEPE